MTARATGLVAALAIALSGNLALAQPAKTMPAEVEGPRVRFEVETSGLGEGGPSMTDMMQALDKEVFEPRGVEVVEDEDAPKVLLFVRPIAADSDIFDNHVEISIVHNDEVVAHPDWTFDCSRCHDGYLLSRARNTLHEAVNELERIHREEIAEAAKESDVVEPSPEPAVTEAAEDSPKKHRPLLWAGGGTALVGLALVGGGIPLVLRDDRVEGTILSDERLLYETRTPGWVMAGIGAAGVVTGVALLSVGIVRAKRSRTKQTAKRPALTPWASRTTFGVGATGRF